MDEELDIDELVVVWVLADVEDMTEVFVELFSPIKKNPPKVARTMMIATTTIRMILEIA